VNDVATNKETSQRAFRIELSPAKVRILSVASLGGLSGWFICKLMFPLSEPWAQLFVGVLALASFISSIIVALSGHAYMANAPEKQLDERELGQRNAAYVRAYQISAIAVLAGMIGLHRLAVWTGNIATAALYENYLTVVFFAHLVLPAAVLAWRESKQGDVDE
jgi:cytochrome bd-type quinol oxidase subunit 2